MFRLCEALKGLRIELKPELSDVTKTKTGLACRPCSLETLPGVTWPQQALSTAASR